MWTNDIQSLKLMYVWLGVQERLCGGEGAQHSCHKHVIFSGNVGGPVGRDLGANWMAHYLFPLNSHGTFTDGDHHKNDHSQINIMISSLIFWFITCDRSTSFAPSSSNRLFLSYFEKNEVR